MTDVEKRRQKADLLLEYQEAEQELAHLKEKARAIRMGLNEISGWLQKITEQPESVKYVSHGKGEMRDINDPIYSEAMNHDAILQLAQSIKTANEKLSELKTRKEGLGLK
jgi:hypothetical protein